MNRHDSLEVVLASLSSYLKKSLVARAGVLLGVIIFIAVISMFHSIIVSESIKGNASAINISGSLRMQSYRIVNYISLYRFGDESVKPQIEKALNDFSTRLTHPKLALTIPNKADNPIRRHYQQIVNNWEQLKAAYFSGNRAWVQQGDYLTEFEQFVRSIDKFVKELQENTESKIRFMSFVQGLAMFLTLMMVFIAMHHLHVYILGPLKRLIVMAGAAGQGDFAKRIPYQSNDELGILAKAFNHMADHLSRLYDDLEGRVEEKTRELQRSNSSLKLLYDSAHKLSLSDGINMDFNEILLRLKEVTQIQAISLCLTRADEQTAYKSMSSSSSNIPNYCQAEKCENCIYSKQKMVETKKKIHGTSFKLMKGKVSYGEIFVQHHKRLKLALWQESLIITVSDHIVSALSAHEKKEHEHRILLMEERAVIARELHDSLAQALSYLKMQLGCLQVVMNKERLASQENTNNLSDDEINKIVIQMREGVDNAYRQLRELLKTFRLKLDEPGLEMALIDTVAEFEGVSQLDIALDYALGHCPLTASEEIHILQITREALANIVQHADASKALLSLQLDKNIIEIDVLDDGKGFPEEIQREGHYGTQIMLERANSLGGELDYGKSAMGGSKVSLKFIPNCFGQDQDVKKVVL